MSKAFSVLRIIGEFVDTRGRRVQEREVVCGDTPDGFARFMGLAVLETTAAGRRRKVPFEFPLAADTLEDAYGLWDDASRRYGNALAVAMRKTQAHDSMHPDTSPPESHSSAGS